MGLNMFPISENQQNGNKKSTHKLLTTERQEKRFEEENETVLLDMKVNILEIYEVHFIFKLNVTI